jgi:superfamily II RNA helicase
LPPRSRPPEAPPSEAGSALLEELLADAAAGAPVTLERLEGIFPFPLDSFQRKSVAALLEGKSVVVCAPTGAGKTAIAEAAAAAVLARGQRVIYTTPLKALSNQKLQEARARFGTGRCGLQVRALGW